MVKFQTVRQKARIILNSDDAVKTTNENHIIPVKDEPVIFDGAVGNNVDVSTDRIHVLGHRLKDGEAFVYTATTVMTASPVLTNGMTLYTRVLSENIFQLATTANGSAINITATGSATQTLTRTILFNGSSATVVNVEDNSIVSNNHGFTTGDYVQYNTSGTVIQGLDNNKYYYVIKKDDNTFKLAESYEEAMITGEDFPIEVDFTGLGSGVSHYFKKIISFDINASPVVDLVNDRLNIPSHPFQTGDMVVYKENTGTAITGLVDNLYYYVIYIDPDSIQLALTKDYATSSVPTAINLSAIGTGSSHSLTRIAKVATKVCTNYRFKLDNKPFDLNDKCRLAVQSFDYVKNYNASKCKSVGGVYLKSILPSNTFASQGESNGTLLLPTYFVDTIQYQNSDIQNYSIPLPSNINSMLHNNLDIFIDSKKQNMASQDINGCIDEDAWNLALIIYEVDEYEFINHELDTKIKNPINPRLV